MEKIILLVLVTIAKVIGILLAVLVIVALAILFAAVRYCGKISFDDKKAQISIRWLGVVLRVPILITEKDLQWKVRVFGVPILRSDGAHKKRRSKKSSAPKAQKRKAEKAAETVQKTQGSSKQEKKALSVNLEKSPTAPEQEKQIAPKQATDQREEQSAFRQADEREKKPRGIRQLFLWLQNVIKIVRKIKKKVHSVQDLVDILRSDAGKAFICIVKENVIHLWKQIHPRRMRGKVIFGTGDPCSTGELLGVLALFYAWYGNGVQIIPDFEQKRIEGNVSFRGRIRMITLICIAWRIIKNKDGRKLLHEWEKWKEEK
ncbi:DUF2953 domain-containing protein [Clostridium sp. AM49-4BH]|uniref:DUF2953 domain-containing protein n=1 Tax=Clostridium sp. AM49-4BH TaxID=2293035 RepID=UPI000E4C2C1E|nr:DUF2953 domain-containing protein [Clostridium sp. AM49-4BH]RHQ12040.1 DUF2953 domain-containing protein [Clostridium sp. AM49-4BH]